ncbi:ABC transporter ATP-binding protein/permease [Nocardioidaceae bacterium]|nr:ABC transporter ATP-binding protein/permease [Nocardioidaceae bacterium]
MPADSSEVDGLTSHEHTGAMEVLRRGREISPQLTEGIRWTLVAAVVASLGRVVVPVAVQQTIDRGLGGAESATASLDVSFLVLMAVLATLAIGVTGYASYVMTARLVGAVETGLAVLRDKAFRHVHDLPVLAQDTERRGALVSRVTGDVDQISRFLSFSGILAVVSVGQILLATVVMAVYDWRLTLVVWLCFAPLFASLPRFQARLAAAYTVVRRHMGTMLAQIAEPVVGAAVVRAHAIEEHTQRRIDTAIDDYRAASISAQATTAVTFSLGGVAAGVANAGVIAAGVALGVLGEISVGEVIAFAFLVNLFVGPVQMGTQVLTDAQNALASWRRVIGILDTPADVVDPASTGSVREDAARADLPAAPVDIHFDTVTYAYPGGPPVLREVDLTIAAGTRVAVVGETGSGKSTLAKLLVRLMDPDAGAVRLGGTDLRDVPFASLRRRVVMVPQEGFLFDSTLAANLRYGRTDATDDQLLQAVHDLDLQAWLDSLPSGLDSRVGQRGEALSAGERQLVALLRAHLADPTLLVLDEATSAVDPRLEVRLGRALERVMSGRTSVTIAHRLSTAERADEVVVVDAGRVVQRGPHADLVAEGGVYGRLHSSWVAQQAG